MLNEASKPSARKAIPSRIQTTPMIFAVVPVRFFSLVSGMPAGVKAFAPNRMTKTPRINPSTNSPIIVSSRTTKGFYDTALNEANDAELREIVPRPAHAAKCGRCAGGPGVKTMLSDRQHASSAGKGRMSFCWITVCFPRQNGKKSKSHVECGTYPLSWSVSSVFHEGRMVYYLLLVAHFFLLVIH